MALLGGLDFDTYFRDQFPQIVSELDYILGHGDLARDVAQDAFIRQYVRWTRLSHYEKPGAWIRRVALQLAFKVTRRLRRQQPFEEGDDGSAENPDSARRLDVRNAIMQLSDQQCTAIVLHYNRDLPTAEVAKSMGCKEATVRVHLFKARAALSELLVDYRL